MQLTFRIVSYCFEGHSSIVIVHISTLRLEHLDEFRVCFLWIYSIYTSPNLDELISANEDEIKRARNYARQFGPGVPVMSIEKGKS